MKIHQNLVDLWPNLEKLFILCCGVDIVIIYDLQCIELYNNCKVTNNSINYERNNLFI